MVEAHRLLRASREHVFAFLAHPEHLPRYGGPLWLSGDLEDRRGGEPLITLRGYFAGLPVEAVVRTAARAPHSLEITQVRGTLRGLSQRFKIETDEEGALLTCRVEVDPGIPMLSDEAARHFLIQYVERMLDRLRLAAERRTPPRRPRPAAKEDAESIDAEAAGMAGDEPAAADQDRGAEEGTAAGAAPTESAPPETAPNPHTEPRRPQRPFPPRRPRPQRSGPPERHTGAPPASDANALPARSAPSAEQGQGASGAADAAAGQGRRRRRRRRRRGRGSPGAAGPGTGSVAGPADNP